MKLQYLAAATALAAAMVVPPPTASADVVNTFQGENLSWVPTTGTSTVNDGGTQARKLTQNTVASIINPTNGSGIVNITVRARGVNASGWPVMAVSVNGNLIANQQVSTATYTDYQFALNVEPSANNIVQIGYINQACGWWFLSYICNRQLFIDSVTVTGPDPEPTPTPEPPPPPTGSMPEGSRYVALGDSYGSGWGADRQPPTTTPDQSVYDSSKCGRSNKSAQALLADEWDAELINVACGGASTNHILTVSYQGEPPQIQAVTSDADLVTVSIGGNDSGLMWILQVCIQMWNCDRADFFGANFLSQLDAKIKALQPKIEAVLSAIIDRAPDAKVRIMGYPYIIAPEGFPRDKCAGWLTAREQREFQKATEATNSKIKAATEAVHLRYPSADLAYLDPMGVDSPFDPELTGCASSNSRYMNGPNDGSQGIWHPNYIGAQHYADLIAGSV